MARYTVLDTETQKKITFEWNEPNQPTDDDLAEIFEAARNMPAAAPEPAKTNLSPDIVPSATATGTQKPIVPIADYASMAPAPKPIQGPAALTPEELQAGMKTVAPASTTAQPRPIGVPSTAPMSDAVDPGTTIVSQRSRDMSQLLPPKEVPTAVAKENPAPIVGSSRDILYTNEPTEIKPHGANIDASQIGGALDNGVTNAMSANLQYLSQKLQVPIPGVDDQLDENQQQIYDEGKRLVESLPSGARMNSTERMYRDYYLNIESRKFFSKKGGELGQKLEGIATAMREDTPKPTQEAIDDAQEWLMHKEALNPLNAGKTMTALLIVTADQGINTALSAIPAVGVASMIGSEGGNFIQGAKAAGVDDPQILANFADLYAVPSGIIEYGTERFVTRAVRGALKGAAKAPAKAMAKAAEKSLVQSLLKEVGETAKSSAFEGTTEFAQANMQNLVTAFALVASAKKHPEKSKQYMDDLLDLDLNPLQRDNLKQFIIGAASSGVMGGAMQAVGKGIEKLAGEREEPSVQSMPQAIPTQPMPQLSVTTVEPGTPQPAQPTSQVPGTNGNQPEPKTPQPIGQEPKPEPVYLDKMRREIVDPDPKHEKIAAELGNKIAKSLGLKSNGPEWKPDGTFAHLLFTDNKTGATFVASSEDEATEKLKQKREEFGELQKAGFEPDAIKAEFAFEAVQDEDPGDEEPPQKPDDILDPVARIDHHVQYALSSQPKAYRQFKKLVAMIYNGPHYSKSGLGVLGKSAHDTAVKNAVKYQDNLGNFSVLAMDFLNQNGGNKEFGHGRMDEIIHDIGKIVMSHFDDAPTALYKTGGDEAGMIIYLPSEEVEARMQKAMEEIQKYREENNLLTIGHGKHNGMPTGTGSIDYGITDSRKVQEYRNEDWEGIDVSSYPDDRVLITAADLKAGENKKRNLDAISAKSGYIYNKEKDTYFPGAQETQSQGVTDEHGSVPTQARSGERSGLAGESDANSGATGASEQETDSKGESAGVPTEKTGSKPVSDDAVIKAVAKVHDNKRKKSGAEPDEAYTLKTAQLNVASMKEAIEEKSPLDLLSKLDTTNKGWRKAFELLTGNKLPSTQKGTAEFIRGYVGAKVYDKAIAEKKADREAKDAKYNEEDRLRKEKALLDSNKGVRTTFEGESEKIYRTRREYLDAIIAHGYTEIKEEQRGATKRYSAFNKERQAWRNLLNKVEAEYVRRRVEEGVAAKAEEKEPQVDKPIPKEPDPTPQAEASAPSWVLEGEKEIEADKSKAEALIDRMVRYKVSILSSVKRAESEKEFLERTGKKKSFEYINKVIARAELLRNVHNSETAAQVKKDFPADSRIVWKGNPGVVSGHDQNNFSKAPLVRIVLDGESKYVVVPPDSLTAEVAAPQKTKEELRRDAFEKRQAERKSKVATAVATEKAAAANSMDTVREKLKKLGDSFGNANPNQLNSIGTEQAELAFEAVSALVDAGYHEFKAVALQVAEMARDYLHIQDFKYAIEDAYDACTDVDGTLPKRQQSFDDILNSQKPVKGKKNVQEFYDALLEKLVGDSFLRTVEENNDDQNFEIEFKRRAAGYATDLLTSGKGYEDGYNDFFPGNEGDGIDEFGLAKLLNEYNKRTEAQNGVEGPGATKPEDVPTDTIPGAGEERGAGDVLPEEGGQGTGPVLPDGGTGDQAGHGEGSSTSGDASSGRGNDAENRGGSGGTRGGRKKRQPGVDPIAPIAPETRGPGNFRITDEDRIGSGGEVTKLRGNIAAIRLMRKIESENRQAAEEEQKILAKFVGWGGLSKYFDRLQKDRYLKEYEELRALFSDDREYHAASDSARNAHYTSIGVFRAMWDAVKRMGFACGNVMEPGMGVGNAFGTIPTDLKAVLHGVELDSITGRIARLLYPNAKIQVKGYQEVKIPKDYYRLFFSNVPFSSNAPTEPSHAVTPGLGKGRALHDFYFLKSLYATEPGGVVAFITSRYTMDKVAQTVRRQIAESADLIGAVRLPDTAFKGNAGTEVVTDIIFLQKRKEGAPMSEQTKRFIDVGPVKLTSSKTGKSADVNVNAYYLDHPEMVIGEHSLDGKMQHQNAYTVKFDKEGGFEAELRNSLGTLPSDIMSNAVDAKTEESEDANASHNTTSLDEENLPLGGFAIDTKTGSLWQKNEETGKLEEVKNDAEQIKGMVRIKNAVRKVLGYAAKGEEKLAKENLKNLNQAYDSFVKKYGVIHAQKNTRLFGQDPDISLLLSIEEYDPKTKVAEKAAIFKGVTIKKVEQVTRVDKHEEAIALSLVNYGRLDIGNIAKLMGKTESEVEQELIDRELVYADPSSFLQDEKSDRVVVLNDEYLSGNVREKLIEANKAAEKNPAFRKNVAALEKVIPKDLTEVDVSIGLNSPVLKNEDVNEFIGSLMRSSRDFGIVHNRHNGKWEVNTRTGTQWQYSQEEFGTERIGALEIIEKLLNGKKVEVYDKLSKDSAPVLNEEQTALAEEKAEVIRKEFQRWLWSNEERKVRVLRDYNDNFNAVVNRRYVHPLRVANPDTDIRFAGSNFPYPARPHQSDAVWRQITNRVNMLAHVVGAGKTLEMIWGSMELRRLGLRKKPMIVVPNHMIPQWTADVYQTYPGAKVLVAREDDFTPSRRRIFMNKCATGDWDIIVVKQSHFKLLPMSKEYQQAFYEREIAEEREALEKLRAQKKGEGKKSQSVKKMEEKIDKLSDKLKKALDTPKDEGVIPFDEMGVDHISVDEADVYKNLGYNTQLENVRGMGTPVASDAAFDMKMKTDFMHQIGGGITFATGTPISNTLAEAYHMMRYLQPDVLKKLGIENFDEWGRIFVETQTALELNNTGTGYTLVTRFSKIKNVPELMSIIREVWDVKTASYLEKENILVAGKNLPFRNNVNISAAATPELKSFLRFLDRREKNLDKKIIESGEDNVLVIINDGKKAALDLRMISPALPDNPQSKLNVTVDRIVEDYTRYKKQKYATVIFLDEPRSYKKVFTGKRDSFGKDIYDSVPIFDAIHDMTQKLIARGVKKDEIADIRQYDTDKKKEQLFEAVNEGKIRVVFGSTKKMGAGTNIQKRLKTLINMDAPWRPRDIAQRVGRIVRQGNEVRNFDENDKDITKDQMGTVNVVNVVTKGSLDTGLWNVLETKSNSIEQIMSSNDTGLRELEEDFFGSAKDLSIDDPLIKEASDLKLQIKKLTVQERAHDMVVAGAKSDFESIPKHMPKAETLLSAMEADLAARPVKPVGEEFKIEVDGKSYGKAEEGGKAVIKRLDSALSGSDHGPWLVGTFAGMSVFVTKISAMNRINGVDVGNAYTIKLSASRNAEYSKMLAYEIGEVSPVGIVSQIRNLVYGGIESTISDTERKINDAKERLKVAIAKKDTPFEHAGNLKDKQARLKEVQKLLSEKSAAAAAEPETIDWEAITGRKLKGSNRDEGEVTATLNEPKAAFWIWDHAEKKYLPVEKVAHVEFPDHPELVAFVYKDERLGWRVIEATSGAQITTGSSKKEAIDNAVAAVQKAGIDRVNEVVRDTIKAHGGPSPAHKAPEDSAENNDEGNNDEPMNGPGAEHYDAQARLWNVDMPKEEQTKERTNKTEIQRYIEKTFGMSILTKGLHRFKATGRYYPKSYVARMKMWGDLYPLIHEVAHHVDTLFKKSLGIQWKLKGLNGKIRDVVTELKDLDYDPKRRNTAEGFAEFVRLWMSNEAEAKRVAPKFFERWENDILPMNQTMAKKLEGLKKMVATWHGQGAENRIVAQIDMKGEHTKIPGAKNKIAKAWEWINENWITNLHKLDRFEKSIGIRHRENIRPSQDPFEVATMRMSKAAGIARTFIYEKAIDFYGNSTGKGLIEVLDPISKEDMNTFLAYGVAKRAIELQKRGIESGFDLDDARYVAKKYAGRGWDKVLDELTEWSGNVSQWLVEAGSLSEEEAKVMRDLNPIYLPFKRAFMEESAINPQRVGPGGTVNSGKGINRIKGSGRPIINPIESLMQQLTATVMKASKIHVASLIADLAGKEGVFGPLEEGYPIYEMPAPQQAVTLDPRQIAKVLMDVGVEPSEDIDIDKFVTVFTQAWRYNGKENIVSIWKDGKRRFYEIRKDLYDALLAMEPVKRGLLLNIISPFARAVRLGATGLQVAFTLKNPIRDTLTYMQYSKSKRPFVTDVLKRIPDAIKPKEGSLSWKFNALGGTLSGVMAMDRITTQKLYDEMLTEKMGKYGKVVNTVKHPINALRELLSWSDIMPRSAEINRMFAHYKKTRPDWTDEDCFIAAFNDAQDVTVNFTRGGRLGKQVNEATAFFNIAVQDLSKMNRELQENPAKFVLRGLTYIAPLALLAWASNRDKDWWDNLEDEFKFNNLFLEVPGTNQVLRIPMPYTIGTIFFSIPLAILENTKHGYESLLNVTRRNLPPITPNVVDPIIDILVNRNFMRKPIEPPFARESAKPEDIQNDYTTWMGILLAKGFNKIGIPISPVQIDYLVYNYTGGFAKQIPMRAITEPAEAPVLKDFLLRMPEKPTRQMNTFWERYKELFQKVKKWKLSKPADRAKVLTSEEYEEFKRVEEFKKYWTKTIGPKVAAANEKNDKEKLKAIYKQVEIALDGLGYK
jgi:N12 class adenine-specific DNA methylase/GGDEF domain-containing protein